MFMCVKTDECKCLSITTIYTHSILCKVKLVHCVICKQSLTQGWTFSNVTGKYAVRYGSTCNDGSTLHSIKGSVN